MARLEFELAYYDFVVQYVSHYTKETPLGFCFCSNIYEQYFPYDNTHKYYRKLFL